MIGASHGRGPRSPQSARAAGPSLRLENLGYAYPNGKTAVAALSVDLRPGIPGLLGPNGAGKSALMRMLATLTRPTRGRILWNGVDIAASPDPLRATLGYLAQAFGAYPSLSGRVPAIPGGREGFAAPARRRGWTTAGSCSGRRLRIVAERAPSPDAEAVEPGLEGAYRALLAGQAGAA